MLAVTLLSSALLIHEIVNLVNRERLQRAAAQSVLFSARDGRSALAATVLKLALAFAGLAFAARGNWTSIGAAVGIAVLLAPLVLAVTEFLVQRRSPGSPCGCSVVFSRPDRHRPLLLILVGATAISGVIAYPNWPSEVETTRYLTTAAIPGVIAVILARISVQVVPNGGKPWNQPPPR